MKTFLYLAVVLIILCFTTARAQTTPATDVAAALDALRTQALTKIQEDVDTNATAFAQAKDINNSLFWSDWFSPFLDIARAVLDGLSLVGGTPTKTPESVRDYLGTGVNLVNGERSVVSLFGSVDRLKQDGSNLSLAIDGPAYSGRTAAMLDRAESTGSGFLFNYDAYRQSIVNDLLGISGYPAALPVSRKSTLVDRSGGEIIPTIHQARLALANRLTALSAQMRQTNLSSATIADLVTFINRVFPKTT